MACRESEESIEDTTEKQQNTISEYSNLLATDTKLNIKCIHCKRCGSKIIKESVATLIDDRKVVCIFVDTS